MRDETTVTHDFGGEFEEELPAEPTAERCEYEDGDCYGKTVLPVVERCRVDAEDAVETFERRVRLLPAAD